MWENDKVVQHFYVTHSSQQSWAILSGIAGWKQVKTGAADGVANVSRLLAAAKTHGRKVNVYINAGLIEQVVML